MATGGDPVYTPETSLGLRLMALITDEGTPLLRRVFRNEVSRMPPRGTSLQEHLENHRQDLYHRLNPDQRKIVYPSGAAKNADKFDITLLCLLLNKLCQTDIPVVGQLRQFRNKNYAHISGTALSKGIFDQLWKELSEILLKLGEAVNTLKENKFLKSRIDQRKVQSVDPKQAKEYQRRFEEFYRQDNEVKDLVVALDDKMCSVIQEGQVLTQRQTTKITKAGKELRHIKSAQGKQHKEVMKTVEEGQKAILAGQTDIIAVEQKQFAEMLLSLKIFFGQQQHNLSEQLTEQVAGITEQSTDMKRETMEKVDELIDKVDGLRVGLTKEQCPTAKETRQSVRGPTPTFEKLRNHLQDRYRRELAKIRPLPWFEDFYLNLEHMYTTLEMVHRKGEKKDISVTVEDMFKLYNDDVPPKTIRVEGNPGIGKTTLCYKIVYDCSAKKPKFDSSDKFSSFQLVLYVEMRQMPHDATDITSTIFKHVFPKAYYKHEEEFWDYVECNPEDALFILDGLDEMPEETREDLKIEDFIRGQIIPGVHVIITSRPYHCNKQLKSCDRHFMIKGYSYQNIESYIDRHPKLDSNSKAAMIKQLIENDSLHELTKNPLNLALLCAMWQEDWSDAVLPQTLTGLYSHLVLAIVKRYAKKCPGISEVSDLSLEEMPEPIQMKLNHLKNLAWKGIQENRLNFSGKAVEGVVEIGFLTKDLNLNAPLQQPFCFKFLHKTFQEYFAAMYMYLCVPTVIGKHPSKLAEASNPFNKFLQNYRYRQVLKFLAGFLGTDARCLFEAFDDSLMRNQDSRLKLESLCLECLHECGTGTELARYVGDVMHRDRHWHVEIRHEVSCRVHQVLTPHFESERVTSIKHNWCRFSCKTNLSSYPGRLEDPRRPKTFVSIRSSEALYGLVHLLCHQAQCNPKLNHVALNGDISCRFLRAVSSTKLFSVLALEFSHGDPAMNEVCRLLKSAAYRDLAFDMSEECIVSLESLNKVLSSVQVETRLSLASPIRLDKKVNQCAFSEAVSNTIRLGSMAEDSRASIAMYIDCADETYISGFVTFSESLKNVVSDIKQTLSLGESSQARGSLKLLFMVRNLPLAEKPTVQSVLADMSSVLGDSTCGIVRQMTFECSCEDGSVVSTIPLLQTLALNQSLTQVSFLCDGPDKVAECLQGFFARNRTLQKLEVQFLHPVDDETMANIFGTYPVDSPCQITSFSVLMKTSTLNTTSDSLSYEQTIRTILNICKNLCDGSALQNITFNTNPKYTVFNSETCETDEGKVVKVKPVCPDFLTTPLVEAIVNSQLTVNLDGIIWKRDTRLSVESLVLEYFLLKSTVLSDRQIILSDEVVEKYFMCPNFKNSNLGHSDEGNCIVGLFRMTCKYVAMYSRLEKLLLERKRLVEEINKSSEPENVFLMYTSLLTVIHNLHQQIGTLYK
ncbi:uncharacterized protein LOC144866106 [Branchiostoma floridae x Branchiostoma japonicum]